MNDVEYDVKNYANQGGCYPAMLPADMDNIRPRSAKFFTSHESRIQ